MTTEVRYKGNFKNVNHTNEHTMARELRYYGHCQKVHYTHEHTMAAGLRYKANRAGHKIYKCCKRFE